MESDGTWLVRCATVMPDHVHLLVVLGERLELSRAVQRLKAKTAGSLGDRAIRWERGYFDRRIRPSDDLFAVFSYIYLNPYRAGLISLAERWPHYFCSKEDWSWFRELLDVERPVPEWL